MKPINVKGEIYDTCVYTLKEFMHLMTFLFYILYSNPSRPQKKKIYLHQLH